MKGMVSDLRYYPPPVPFEWTPESIALLGSDTDSQIADMLGISIYCVARKRSSLGIPSYVERNWKRIQWTKRMLAMLGKMQDSQVAAHLRIDANTVMRKRRSLNIPPKYKSIRSSKKAFIWSLRY